MKYEVEVTDEFTSWWNQLSEREQDDATKVVEALEEQGTNLPKQYSSSIRTSRHGHMRELRVQSGGRPIRIFYAFDPRRTAILLIGGRKRGGLYTKVSKCRVSRQRNSLWVDCSSL